MNKTKIGIIGCGKQATKHIDSLQSIPGVDIIVTDIEPSLAQNIAKHKGLLWAQNPDQLFNDDEIKGIVICTPTLSHCAYIKKAVRAGKDVFCEKPLSSSIEETLELQELTATSNRIVIIGYVYRYVPIFEEGFKLFRKHQTNGESLIMGKPLSAFFRLGGRGSHQAWKHIKREGGGAINEMLVHVIDLANWYFGPLHSIEVLSCDLRKPERTIQGKKISVDSEDFIIIKALGNTNTEIICQADLITASFNQFVEIQAENGSFLGSIQSDFPSYIFLTEGRGAYDAGKTSFQFGRRNIFDIQMLAFVQALIKNQQPRRNTIEDSLMLMKIMEQIRNQIED